MMSYKSKHHLFSSKLLIERKKKATVKGSTHFILRIWWSVRFRNISQDIAIRRHFGANTTWYWHLHVVCCRFAISFSFMQKDLLFFVAVGQPQLYSTNRSFSLYNFSTLPGKAGGCLCVKANKTGRIAKMQCALFYIFVNRSHVAIQVSLPKT